MLAFRQQSAATGFELATAERYVLAGLWHTGRIAALRERTWTVLREANRRGDRNLTAQIETAVLPIVYLADDDVVGATAVLDRALTNWPRPPPSLLHWQQAQLRSLVALYAGRPDEALRVMAAQKTSAAHGLFTRIKTIRIFTLFVHASALLGVAATDNNPRPLLRRAERMVREIEKSRMADDTVALLRGQIGLLRGNGDAKPTEPHFATAEALFAQRGMRLASLVAGYGAGIIIGGDIGRRRADEALHRLRAETIRRPEGFVRLFAPGLAPTWVTGPEQRSRTPLLHLRRLPGISRLPLPIVVAHALRWPPPRRTRP